MYNSLLKKYAKKLLPHRRDFYLRMLFGRTSQKSLSRLLVDLGLKEGAVVLVHCAFSQLGYFPKGAVGLIKSIQEIVGVGGTIAMPAFSSSDSMQSFLSKPQDFDVMHTPSKVGYLSETFRTFKDVHRSIHPTHSICALGKYAKELVEGHQLSETPCGANSPFARLGSMNAVLLRIGTGSLPLRHHTQELVGFPNQFISEKATIPCKNRSGKEILVHTRVYRKQIPNILFLGDDTPSQLFSIHPKDFPLLFSGDREDVLRKDPKRQQVLNDLRSIRTMFIENGSLRMGEINGCRCELFDVKDFIVYAVREQKRLISKYRNKYSLNNLRLLLESGNYPG